MEIFEVLTRRIAWLEAAVARDPKFVLAYCELSEAHDSLYSYRIYATAEQRMVDHRALAETALHKAMRLRPDTGEVHLAAALHFFQVTHDQDQ